ncbi:MAG: T9SS type A sorting domain-containing protein [Bacteroidales bacterium]|nr:T9SS type A sorting domain-containing protein [Bacteroidales bacterium]
MKKIFFFIFSFALSLNFVSAQWSNNAALNNAIGALTGEQAIPKIATCPNGDTYIGFFSNESGNYDVRLQRLDSQGNELWATGGILISNNASMTWLTDWDMTADVNNHCVLTWQDIRNGNNNAYAYRISPSGSFVWGPNGIALSNNSEFNASPKVTCTAAGNAVFAWASGDVIIMQKINPAGAKQWGDNGITLTSSNTLSWPQLMPVGSDDVVMKYFEDSGPPNAVTRLVYAQRYSSTGTPVWTSPTIISDATGISSWTQIFPFINDGSDGFYIAWHDDRDNNQLASVWVQHISSSGDILFAADGIEASTQGGMNHYYPYLALPPGSNDVYVFWNEMNGLQSLKGILGQKLSSTGTRQWGNSGMVFIPVSATQVLPLGAGSTPTDVMVLYDESISASASALKAMRIANDGSFVWPGNFVNVSTASSSKVHTVINDFQDNQWIISWEDNRNGASDIYAQNLLPDGSLGVWDPQYGSLQGQVTLNGGPGNVTQVVVTAGSESTYPDATGYYIFNSILVGTYDVSASLAGYYPSIINDVIVIENQATLGVDFLLEPIPTTGYIEGQVILSGGSGDVTQTLITAGSHTTHPNSGGFYNLETEVGIWDVEANLAGYTPQIRAGINVAPGETTPDVDFTLSPLPTTGYLQGTIILTGGTADVTLATVTAGTQTVHPGANGFYFMEITAGIYTVTATHPYTDTQSLENIVVEPGLSTAGVNFTLNVMRTDLVCKAVDQFGGVVYDAEIEVTGPEGTYSGIITGDSLVFEIIPYGLYEGTGTINGSMPVYSDTLIDGGNHHLVFVFIVGSTSHLPLDLNISVQPNPATPESRITIETQQTITLTIELLDSEGKSIGKPINGMVDKGINEWPLHLLTRGKDLSPGLYLLAIRINDTVFTKKILINNQ